MRLSSVFLPLAAAFSIATAAAQNPSEATLERAPKKGEILRDTNARIVGKVFKVLDNGDVLAIVNRDTVSIPAETLSIVDGKLVTTLSKAEARKR